jgi:hypothetical protein
MARGAIGGMEFAIDRCEEHNVEQLGVDRERIWLFRGPRRVAFV